VTSAEEIRFRAFDPQRSDGIQFSVLKSNEREQKIMTQRDWLLIGGGLVAGALLGVSAPKLRRHLGPVIAEAGLRAGGVFSALAETVATQMERAEDYAEERRAARSHAA
jgi:hypothetical protein